MKAILFLLSSLFLLPSLHAASPSEQDVGVVHILNFPSDSPYNPYYSPQPQRPPAPPPPGHINVDFSLPVGDTVSVTITPHKGSSFTAKLLPVNGAIHWESRPLPPGHYDITYTLPVDYEPIPTQTIHLTPRQQYRLTPSLKLIPRQPTVHVIANISEVIYILTSLKTKDKWRGSGRDFIFENIPTGPYELSFSTSDPASIAPKPIRFNLNDRENKEIKVAFELSGTVSIKTNFYPSQATFQQLSGKKSTYQYDVTSSDQTFSLPEGRYLVTLSTTREESDTGLTILSPKPIQIAVTPLSSQHLDIPFILENPAQATQNPLPPPTEAIPPPLSPIQEVVTIPSGPALIGDPSSPDTSKWVHVDSFSIGIYEVTNAQYAAWLNEAFKKGTIAFVSEADNRGQVLDEQGHLLFKTFAADPYSQIVVRKSTMEGITFVPLPGKDKHPVINVSWYGASAFCKDRNCRLPTEAEWEKAGGMSPPLSPEEKGKRYIYGFGQNTIDPSWANYKTSDAPLVNFRVLTTPVGFYDGVNKLPLSLNTRESTVTHLAKSPYGAFDMSGNVWEWVDDWYTDGYPQQAAPASGDKKVAKGGCYDSLADGVRISERMPLPPDHTDAYTGFRIAIDPNRHKDSV